jgi:hypothetical protein
VAPSDLSRRRIHALEEWVLLAEVEPEAESTFDLAQRNGIAEIGCRERGAAISAGSGRSFR